MADAPPRPSAAAASARKPRRWLSTAIMPVAVGLGLLALWEIGTLLFSIPTYIVPAPSVIGQTLFEERDTLLRNLVPTAVESVLGFLIGNAIAVLLAIWFVHSQSVERALMPWAVIVRTIPIVALAPIFVIVMGHGLAPKIAIAALICFFPTLINMVRGFRAVDPQILELLRVLDASRLEVFLKVRTYSSIPYLFASLRIAATAAVIGAVVAEWIGSQAGLGALIINATFNFRTPLLYATMVVACGLAVLFFVLIGLIERRVVTWKPSGLPE